MKDELPDFLNAMLAADVAVTTGLPDTPEAGAMRSILHLTTLAGKTMLEGGEISPEWRMMMVTAVMTPIQKPEPKEDDIPCNEL